jgi:hypothetical protein
MMPIPQDVEASTKNLMIDVGGGFDKEEPQKSAESWERHHFILVLGSQVN